jgi:hypothetical protein
MLARMLGAIRMNVDTYEDVEGDRSATWQALAVVVIVALCLGIGSLLAAMLSGEEETGNILGLLSLTVLLVGAWAIWALVTWVVGGFLLKTPETVADWGQLARGTGFAFSPGVFFLLVFIPFVGGLIGLVAFIWVFVCMVIAVRQCLDYTSTLRAFFVILISAIPTWVLFLMFVIVLGLTASVVS